MNILVGIPVKCWNVEGPFLSMKGKKRPTKHTCETDQSSMLLLQLQLAGIFDPWEFISVKIYERLILKHQLIQHVFQLSEYSIDYLEINMLPVRYDDQAPPALPCMYMCYILIRWYWMHYSRAPESQSVSTIRTMLEVDISLPEKTPCQADFFLLQMLHFVSC